MTFLYIILATVAVSLISLVGVLAIVISRKKLDNIVLLLVALAAGGLMGGAFLHLLPEAIHEAEHKGGDIHTIFLYTILGFIIFLFVEQYLHWHECHGHSEKRGHRHEHKDHQPMSRLILIGDGVHNLIDGLIIAASFMAGPMVGITTTIAVALHEIPQEIGDFGVLVYGGYKKSRALFYNFLSGLTAVLGGVLGYVFAETSEEVALYLLPIAAGGFIYIAASDLVPEIKRGKGEKRMALQLGIFVFGIVLMFLMKRIPFLGH